MDGSATTRVDYGSEEAAMQAYLREGEKRAASLGNRGPIRFTASGELHPDIVDAYWRCGFYVFEGVLEARRAQRHRTRRARHPRPPSGRARCGARCQGPAGAGGGLRRAEPAVGQAARRSVRRHRSRQRPPSGEDVRAQGRRRRAQGGRLSHPGLAAVLRGGAARLWPSRASRRRRRDQRAGLHAVQRGAVHQGAGPRRLRRLAPGRRHPLEQPRLGPGRPRLQLHGPALRLHRGQRRVGRAGLAQARQGRHQEAGRRGRQRAAARRRADHRRSRATSPSPTARRCTAPSPTPARTGASR